MNFDFSRAAPRTNVQTGGTNAGTEAIRVRAQGQQSLLHGVAQFGEVAERWRREGQQDRFRDRGMEIQAEEQEKRRQAAMDLEMNKSRLNNLVKSGMLAIEQDTSIKDEASFDAAFGKIKERIDKDFRDTNKGFRDRQPDLTKGHWDDMNAIALANLENNAREWFAKKQRADDLAVCKLSGENAVAELNPEAVESAYRGLLLNGVNPEIAAAQKKEWLGQIVAGKVDSIIAEMEKTDREFFPVLNAQAVQMVRDAAALKILSSSQAESAINRIDQAFATSNEDYKKQMNSLLAERKKEKEDALKRKTELLSHHEDDAAKTAFEDAAKLIEEIYADDPDALKDARAKLELKYRQGEESRKTFRESVSVAERDRVQKQTGDYIKQVLAGAGLSEIVTASKTAFSDFSAALPVNFGEGIVRDATTQSDNTEDASNKNYGVIASFIVSSYDPEKDADGLQMQRLFIDSVSKCDKSDAKELLRLLAWKSNLGGVKPTQASFNDVRKMVYAEMGLDPKKTADERDERIVSEALGKISSYLAPIPEHMLPQVIKSVCAPIKKVIEEEENAESVRLLSENYAQRVSNYTLSEKKPPKDTRSGVLNVLRAAQAAGDISEDKFAKEESVEKQSDPAPTEKPKEKEAPKTITSKDEHIILERMLRGQRADGTPDNGQSLLAAKLSEVLSTKEGEAYARSIVRRDGYDADISDILRPYQYGLDDFTNDLLAPVRLVNRFGNWVGEKTGLNELEARAMKEIKSRVKRNWEKRNASRNKKNSDKND